MKAEQLIGRLVASAGRHMRLLALAEGALGLTLFVGSFIFGEIVADHVVALSQGTRMGLLALLAACALVIVVGAVAVPLVRSISRAYVARRIEDAFPEFRNSLVTYIQMARSRADDGMLALVANQAARRVHLVNIDAALDSRRFTRLGYSLVALMLAVLAYSVFAPKSMWTSLMRVTRPWESIAAPTRTEIEEVLPGDARLPQGADLVVTASMGGVVPEAAAVRWSRDGTLWQAAPMEPSGDKRWRGVVPHVEADVTYRVAAGDAVSQVYRVSTLAPPVVTSVKARLLYPSYTRLAPLDVEDGNVEAPEGTEVQLIVEANKDLQSASLKLPRDTSAVLKTRDQSALGGFTVTDTGRYAIVITDTDGLSPSRPVEYDILALPDREPKVSLEGPADGAVAGMDDGVPFRFSAVDDYGISRLVFHFETGEGTADIKTFVIPEGRREASRPTVLVPQFLGARPGDTIRYYVEAFDNREGGPNASRTELRRLRVSGGPTATAAASTTPNAAPATAALLPGRAEPAAGTPVAREDAASSRYLELTRRDSASEGAARERLLAMLEKDKAAWDAIARHYEAPQKPSGTTEPQAPAPAAGPDASNAAENASENSQQSSEASQAPDAGSQQPGEKGPAGDKSPQGQGPAGPGTVPASQGSPSRPTTEATGAPPQGATPPGAGAATTPPGQTQAAPAGTGNSTSSGTPTDDVAPGRPSDTRNADAPDAQSPGGEVHKQTVSSVDSGNSRSGDSDSPMPRHGQGTQGAVYPQTVEIGSPSGEQAPDKQSASDQGAAGGEPTERTGQLDQSGQSGKSESAAGTPSPQQSQSSVDGPPSQGSGGAAILPGPGQSGGSGQSPSAGAPSGNPQDGPSPPGRASSDNAPPAQAAASSGGSQGEARPSGQASASGSPSSGGASSGTSASGGGKPSASASPRGTPQAGETGDLSRTEAPVSGSDNSQIATVRRMLSKVSEGLGSGKIDESLLSDLGWKAAQLATFVRRYQDALTELKDSDSEGEVEMKSNLDSGEVVGGSRTGTSVGRLDSAGSQAEKDTAEALKDLPREAVLPGYQPIVDEYYKSLTGER